MTVQQLIETSLGLIGRLGAARGAGPSESAHCFRILNTLIANWNTQRRYVMGLDTVTVAVTSGTRSYTLAARPAHIERAEFLVTAGGLSYPVPLLVLAADAFALVPNQGDVTPYPKAIWCDYGYPTAAVSIAPTPAAGSLKLYTWQVIAAFAALTDVLALPPGIERALIHGLAVELAPLFEKPLSPGLIAQTTESKNGMERLNDAQAAMAGK